MLAYRCRGAPVFIPASGGAPGPACQPASKRTVILRSSPFQRCGSGSARAAGHIACHRRCRCQNLLSGTTLARLGASLLAYSGTGERMVENVR